ncbi:inner centromere protein-like [Branchiostoma floridae]|uniref:Inner centromere protein-like n=1 Tax=Branchiostoma floridae TaxID=7739 RepID=A0A9J7M3Z1_BRAFL|nr:inner centromere protein-like [Branchiostoma floridae]
MSVKEPFRVEDLLSSVRELQKEKSLLEHELAEAKRRTKETENKLDEVSQQHRQISVLYNKMVETLKIAKHKVDQSQQMADNQEQVNQDKRASLTELNSSIEQEVQRQRQYSREFESQLDELTDASHHAWLYFKAESIEKELLDLEAMKTEAERLAEQQEEEVSALTERLNDIKLQQGIDTSMDESQEDLIPYEMQQNLYRMFYAENDMIHGLQTAINTTYNMLQTKLQRLRQWENPGDDSQDWSMCGADAGEGRSPVVTDNPKPAENMQQIEGSTDVELSEEARQAV